MDMVFDKSYIKIVSLILSATYVFGAHRNYLYETIPMCTYNICLFNNHKDFNKLFSAIFYFSVKLICRMEQIFM